MTLNIIYTFYTYRIYVIYKYFNFKSTACEKSCKKYKETKKKKNKFTARIYFMTLNLFSHFIIVCLTSFILHHTLRTRIFTHNNGKKKKEKVRKKT